jgi:hypothetical protein
MAVHLIPPALPLVQFPFGWYWGDSFRCCVPSHPGPPPKCSPGWEWISGNYKCQPVPTRRHQQPSQASHGRGGHGRKKRTQKVRANNLCPDDLTTCPVVGAHIFSRITNALIPSTISGHAEDAPQSVRVKIVQAFVAPEM